MMSHKAWEMVRSYLSPHVAGCLVGCRDPRFGTWVGKIPIEETALPCLANSMDRGPGGLMWDPKESDTAGSCTHFSDVLTVVRSFLT